MVVGIVLTLGAVVLPFTLREIEQRREAEAFDRFGLLCRMARADARASGVPVVLRVDEDGRILEARRLDPRSDAMPSSMDSDPERGFLPSNETDEDASTPIPAAWARLELPEGCRCEPPPDPESFDAFAPIEDAFGESATPLGLDPPGEEASPAWEAATRLVLFLPDGAAVSARIFGVRTSQGWRPIEIEPYGGRPSVGEILDPEAVDLEAEWSSDDDLPDESASTDLDGVGPDRASDRQPEADPDRDWERDWERDGEDDLERDAGSSNGIGEAPA